MGDPIRIVDNITQKSILSLCFDNDDSILTVTTEDYKLLMYDFSSILDDNLNLKINLEKEMKLDLVVSYLTKKTSLLSMKHTSSNVLLVLGRFDDNDPKIFM
jgi:hypothetical protein